MNKNEILQRPNGKYWQEEDFQAREDAKTYNDLLIIALRILDRMPEPRVQICGPISTGGKGSIEANIAEFEKAILYFSAQGENVFDQMPFEEAMQRIKKDVVGYDKRLLNEFYLPIFKSGKIKKLLFLPGWKSSEGASWEHEQTEVLKIAFVDLPNNWYMSDYEKRGVSSEKEDVHNAIKNIDKGIFPNAFCKIIPDMFADDPKYCNIVHADGAGTKTSLAYLYWKETGDLSVWKGVVQDSIVMNLDDLICVGAVNVRLLLSSTIGRNKHLIPGEVTATIINGAEEFCQKMRNLGIEIYTTGGETADLGDLVRTIVIDNTLSCRMKQSDIINVNIQPGDLIVGLASFGKASYEDEYNGGMGSNGLTNSRHDIFNKKYIEKYPESFDPILLEKCPELVYRGKYRLGWGIPLAYHMNDPYEKYLETLKENMMTIGKLVLSPTRTYAPIIKEMLNKKYGYPTINGIIHCSGGGQTKVMKFVENVHVIKDNLFPTPPLFKIIKDAGEYHGEKMKEMYSSFNMGHRMEVYVPSQELAEWIIDIAKSFNIDAQIIGCVEAYEGKKLTIKTEHGEFVY